MRRLPKVIIEIEPSTTYSREFLRGIAKYLRLHQSWIVLTEPAESKGLSPFKIAFGGDGVIAEIRTKKAAKDLAKLGLPIVVVAAEEYITDYPLVLTNDEAIGKMAAEHLLEHGFKNFAFCGIEKAFWSARRAESFRKRIAKAGFQTHFYKPEREGKKTLKDERDHIAEWLQSLPKPAGLMACNDFRARDIIETYKSTDIKVPDDLAIIGVDNDDVFCEMSYPPLSSVALNVESAGFEAAEILEKMMSGQEYKEKKVVVQPTRIVTRQSTDIFAIEDSDLIRAIQYIRERWREPIQVFDVVRAAALSRRALEKKFREVLNRSIHQEIRRVRVNHISKMLLETNLPVSRLEEAMKYPFTGNLARYFRREKGMTPLAYRKKYGRV